MMAASASLSVSIRPTQLSPPQSISTRNLVNSFNPSSRILPLLNSRFRNPNLSIIHNQKIISFNTSAFRGSQPSYQTNLEDEPSSGDSQGQPSSLKYLMQAYKEALVYGDKKTIYEIENLLIAAEKEKNELAQKVLSMSTEISSGKEKLLRLQADFENYRKRSEKEKLNSRSNAQGEVIESLLPMVDSFERAKQQLKLETEREKKIDTSYQGIYKQLVEIMRSLQVAAVPTVGKPFDPSKHEAIAREESEEYSEGIVIQELRRGFYLGDRLLRPAMVKVSSGPGKKKPAASVAGANNL